MDGLLAGPGYLGRGLTSVRRRPRLLLLGMLPALLVFCLLAAAFVALLFVVGDLAGWATPFADDWSDLARGLLRFLLAAAVVVGALVLASAVFTGLTLTVGDPCYERIWRATEESLGGTVPAQGLGLWRSALDGLRLAALGLGFSLLVLLSGFLPFIGPLLGVVLGVTLSGRLLGRELLSRPLEARGMDAQAQQAVLAPHRGKVLGFGVATQLCFLVPFGGVLIMPAAVAGATILARDLLDQAPSPRRALNGPDSQP